MVPSVLPLGDFLGKNKKYMLIFVRPSLRSLVVPKARKTHQKIIRGTQRSCENSGIFVVHTTARCCSVLFFVSVRQGLNILFGTSRRKFSRSKLFNFFENKISCQNDVPQKNCLQSNARRGSVHPRSVRHKRCNASLNANYLHAYRLSPIGVLSRSPARTCWLQWGGGSVAMLLTSTSNTTFISPDLSFTLATSL